MPGVGCNIYSKSFAFGYFARMFGFMRPYAESLSDIGFKLLSCRSKSSSLDMCLTFRRST